MHYASKFLNCTLFLKNHAYAKANFSKIKMKRMQQSCTTNFGLGETLANLSFRISDGLVTVFFNQPRHVIHERSLLSDSKCSTDANSQTDVFHLTNTLSVAFPKAADWQKTTYMFNYSSTGVQSLKNATIINLRQKKMKIFAQNASFLTCNPMF